MLCCCCIFFLQKKTAYERRISDWSSDVCSSDLDKAETAAKHGDEQVKIWRRSFDTPPPPLEAGSPWDLSNDPRYAGIAIPATESLKDTIARVLPYYERAIAPELAAGKTVLISAHGNSLGALVKHLMGIPDADMTGLEIPNGTTNV